MGLGTLIAVLKTVEYVKKDRFYGSAARFLAKIFAANFAMGVITGIPMEFQFGTNWSHFAAAGGAVIGQTLAMEGTYAFLLESGFLGVFLLGEKKVSSTLHWLSSIFVAGGSLISGYFIVMTDAWMQHPVGYAVTASGAIHLTSLRAVLTNPYGMWQYWHTINGAFLTGAAVMAGLGAYYLLSNRDIDYAKLFMQFGVGFGLLFALVQLFPTGSKHAENLARFQPIKTAAMEGLFTSQTGAPLAIIGMPDTVNKTLLDPVLVYPMLSMLIYGNSRALVKGLDAYPQDLIPPVEIVYYAYHIMVGLGTIMIGIFALGAILWRTGKLFSARWYLWLLLITPPLPYIANEAGWTVAEVGRQPWIVYGIMKTAVGISPNVSAGETVFSLLGFMGLYAFLGLVFLYIVLRILAVGPTEDARAADAGEQVYPTAPSEPIQETHN
jgi:cytochrome d ubiquinol oxidase subunit I